LSEQDPDLHFLVPMVNAKRRAEFEAILHQHPLRHCHIVDQDSGEGDDAARRAQPAAWNVMESADAVLAASGTATLEACLFKRPLVISYVLSPMMRRMMAWKSGQERPYVPWVGLPNVLAQDFVVPELLQEEATPEALAEASWKALTDKAYANQVAERFRAIHESLRRDTPLLAAQAILGEVGRA
jgi:lipid-A-disaccharide synthase